MLGEQARVIEEKKDLTQWIKRNFFIPETRHDPDLRGRIDLVQYQEDLLREILTPDENGLFKYSTIVWSDIKKSWKSTIAAGVNLALGWHNDWGEQYIIANDLKQADSRVNHYLRRGVQLNPEMKKVVRTPGTRVVLPSNTYIEAIPIDPSGEAGTNAQMITFSELWGANEKEKQRMWSEMTIPPGKFGKGFRWVESYAGFTGESELLYSLYELGVKKGEMLWPDRLYPTTDGPDMPLEVYVNRTARLICLWNTVPRNYTQTKDYYASEQAILLPNEFLRMHRNQWVSSTETFVPIEWWDNCKRTDEEWPKIDKERYPVIIIMDAGIADDNFGMVLMFKHPTNPTDVCVERHRKWVPDSGHKLNFQGTEADPGPEMVLDQWLKEYKNVVQVCYDEYQLHDLATRWKQKGRAWFYAFPQGNDRLVADSQHRTLIRERRIWHRGETDLRDHVQNSDAKIDEQDRKIRIVKKADSLKIDLNVCMSMGAHEILRLNL